MASKTTGEILKERLGLSHLKYVELSRVLISTYKVYLVFYDSRKPNFPITTKRALKSDHIGMLYQYPFEDEPMVLPLIHLHEFNGPLHPAMFFVVDLSGEYGVSKNKVDLKRESIESVFFGSLKEYVTLSNLKTADVISPLTKRTRSQRNRAVGSENRTAKLVDLNIDTVEDHVTFIFKTTATVPIYPEDSTFKQTDIETFELKRNPSKEYDLYIRVLDFFKWFDAQKQEKDISEITTEDIKRVLEVSNVQVFSTSPSFHWQGFSYWLSQLDGSVYPTNIKPKFWDTIHGDGDAFLDKHLYGLLRQIAFFRNQMASMLTKRLKQRELI
jgi:hypothetical protein